MLTWCCPFACAKGGSSLVMDCQGALTALLCLFVFRFGSGPVLDKRSLDCLYHASCGKGTLATHYTLDTLTRSSQTRSSLNFAGFCDTLATFSQTRSTKHHKVDDTVRLSPPL